MQVPDYDPTFAAEPLSDGDLDALEALLAAVPSDRAMNVEALDGYLTALLLGPRLAHALPAARWLPAVWGGDEAALDGGGPRDGAPSANHGSRDSAPFASAKQRKRVAVLALRHLRGIETALDGPPEAWEPLFAIAGEGEQERVDAEDWCIGFLLGTAVDSAAWAPHWDDALMAPLVRLGADEAPIDDDDERDALSRAAADAVAALAARRTPSTRTQDR